MRLGDLEVDEAAREVRIAGVEVRLRPREFALLLVLAKHSGIALSRSKLLELAWGYDFDGDDRTLDVHIRRLRMKIEEQHGFQKCIHTLYGFGYKFLARSARGGCVETRRPRDISAPRNGVRPVS
jgi:DNA-binding response OmpR family regulator